MARDPGSVWNPLPEQGDQGNYDKTQFIVHSTGTRASASANRSYFGSSSVVVESTFIVGLTAADRTLQILDSTERADANASANQRGISIEVVGLGSDPFSGWQMSELIRLGRWARKAHNIPARIIRTESDPGFGWHVMFGAPGPWTSVRGKVCPGTLRIKQLREIVFPAIFASSDPVTAKPEPVPEKKKVPDMFVCYYGATGARLVTGDRIAAIDRPALVNMVSAGIPLVKLTNLQVELLQAQLKAETTVIQQVDSAQPAGE